MNKNFKKIIAAILCMVTVLCAAMPAAYSVNETAIQAAEYDSEVELIYVAPVTAAAVNAKQVITVKAFPAEAAEGKFVVASLSEGAKAEIRNPELIFINGEAKFEVTALSSASFDVYFDVADSDLSAVTTVKPGSVATNAVDDPNVVEVTGISIDSYSATITVANTFNVNATVIPADADNQNVIWTSSKKSVATVDQTGRITAISKGSAWIIATTEDGGFNAICKVTVINRKFTATWYVDGNKYAENVVEEGAVLPKPVNPSKLGHNFIGWKDANGQLTTVPSIMPSHDIKFYAYFEKVTATEPIKTDVKIKIVPPSRYAVNYGDSLYLNAVVTGTLDPGMMVIWNASNDNFTLDVAYGAKNCRLIPTRDGSAQITAMVIDENENVIAYDAVVMTSNASFFYKVIAFIKGIFGLNVTYYTSI